MKTGNLTLYPAKCAQTMCVCVFTCQLQVRDHYQYLEKDISNIAARAKNLNVSYVITTEKDMVRLCEHMPLDFSVLWVPLKVNLEPAVRFHAWLQNRLNAARAITLGN